MAGALAAMGEAAKQAAWGPLDVSKLLKNYSWKARPSTEAPKAWME